MTKKYYSDILLLMDDILKLAEGAINRRGFLKAGLLFAAASLSPQWVLAGLRQPPVAARALSFYNTHTGEELETVYWSKGGYLTDALRDINYILRDHYTGEVGLIDRRLIDLLYTLRSRLDIKQPFHIVSGYRSHETNAELAGRSKGVAKNSLHLEGKAIDIRVPEINLSFLHSAATTLGMGGVGYYPTPNFVHLDVGAVRYW